MTRRLTTVLVALALAGCAAQTLRYTPDQQPSGSPISADYRQLEDRLRVEIDTGGYRLEEAQILRADGVAVPARTIEHPGYRGGGSGLGLGLGVGSIGRSGGVGIGTGVGVGTTLGPGRAEGNTFADFPLAEAGPAPWRLRVKVVGVTPVVIVLDPDKPATR